MRETSLTRNASGEGPGRIRILTGDRGTEILDEEGRVLREFGTDRHAEQVAHHEAEGWRVTRTRHRRPPGAARTPPARDATAAAAGGEGNGAPRGDAAQVASPKPDQEAG
jgi:hypothetical protein